MSAGWWETGEVLFARAEGFRTRTIGECHEHDWRSDRHGNGVCVTCGQTATEAGL